MAKNVVRDIGLALQSVRPGEKIRHFYPLASRASGTKNPLALMIF